MGSWLDAVPEMPPSDRSLCPLWLKALMELDFDKEIDALLRKETAGRTITISEFRGGLHLDADEIAAFAERRVPPGVRQSFVEHLAACDRCRKVLLNAAWLNAEEEPAAQEGIAAPAVQQLPWYRRLFLFPNLAYVMGGLVVLFAGFIGLSVLTYRSGQSDLSRMSQAESEPAISETHPVAIAPFANTNSSVASTANTMTNAANSAANVPYEAFPTPAANAPSNTVAKELPVDAPADEQRAKVLRPSTQPLPQAPSKDNNYTMDGVDSRRMQELRNAPAPERERDNKKAEDSKAGLADVTTQRSVGPMPKMKGPMRNDRNERNIALDAEKNRSVTKTDTAPTAGASTLSAAKRVGGRTFVLRQGAWYDTAYSGQGTINVRRNTSDYRKLDSGLRGISESFIGTVVVTIWNGRAYRIQ
jgi:hypothetical protein